LKTYIFSTFTQKPLTNIQYFFIISLPPGVPGTLNTKGSIHMSIDVKGKIEELASKLQKDPALLQSFHADPVKTLEKLTGLNLPDEQLQPLVAGIKAKLAASDLSGKLDGLKKLF